MRRSHCVLAFLIAPLVASSGCGGGNTIWVTGQLLKGGTPYVPPKDQLVTITFISLEVQDPSRKAGPGEAYQAEYDPAKGTFSVPGLERQGIPPGKYRVAVTQKLTREAFDATKPKGTTKKKQDRETDMLGDQFGLSTSKITVEVKRSEELTIDLDQH